MVSDGVFASLAYFIGVCVRAAGAVKDYTSPILLLDVCFNFHRVNAKYDESYV